jgi:hypothetical protein
MSLILMPNSRLLYTVQCCGLLYVKFIKVALGNCGNNITCYWFYTSTSDIKNADNCKC